MTSHFHPGKTIVLTKICKVLPALAPTLASFPLCTKFPPRSPWLPLQQLHMALSCPRSFALAIPSACNLFPNQCPHFLQVLTQLSPFHGGLRRPHYLKVQKCLPIPLLLSLLKLLFSLVLTCLYFSYFPVFPLTISAMRAGISVLFAIISQGLEQALTST